MNLFEKIILEMAEYNADDEYTKYSKKLVDKFTATKKYTSEYEILKKLRKHLKLDYKAKKTLEKSISELKIKDQIEVNKVINELPAEYNKQMFRALGVLLAEYLREYAINKKDYDDDLYIELIDSNLLSKESKKELELSQKALISKSSKVTSKLSADDIRIMSQQKFYELLFAEQHDILYGKARLGMVFKKYLDESTLRMTLIDKYLLHRLIDLIYSGFTKEEIEDRQ